MNASHLSVPLWLIHVSVAAVWFYEGIWCKLLKGEPHQLRVVQSVPISNPRSAAALLKLLGAAETGLAVWVLTGIAPLLCASTQTVLLVALNASGLLWARHLIHDPPGMIVKNFAFLILAWVSASFPTWN